MNSVVRIATNNNFNCTPKEWAQVKQFEQDNPNKIFFVNTNIKTPKLLTVNDHPNKVVITANPNLIPNYTDINNKLWKLKKDKVAFLRVKWIPEHPEIDRLLDDLSQHFPIVVTLQRFNGKKSLTKYTSLDHYKFECSRYRLHGPALYQITTLVDALVKSGRSVWICDRKGLGCQGCGLCSQLTTGQDLPVSSLNLSSSGICPYNCPDCYAKTMQNFSRKMGHKPILFDKVMKNEKQAGRTQHIKRNRKK